MGIFSKICFAILLFGVSTPLAHGDTTAGPDGLWSAVIVVGKAEVPFRFEVRHTANNWQGFFFKGIAESVPRRANTARARFDCSMSILIQP